jgi:hypothetical protein
VDDVVLTAMEMGANIRCSQLGETIGTEARFDQLHVSTILPQPYDTIRSA